VVSRLDDVQVNRHLNGLGNLRLRSIRRLIWRGGLLWCGNERELDPSTQSVLSTEVLLSCGARRVLGRLFRRLSGRGHIHLLSARGLEVA